MGVHVDHLCDEVLLHAMLAVGSTDAALLHAGMESLHGLEVSEFTEPATGIWGADPVPFKEVR